MINAYQLRKYVIRPVLELLQMHQNEQQRINAEILLLGIAAQESLLGLYLHQHPTGPAIGIYQMEGWVHDDQWESWLVYRQPVAECIWPLTMLTDPEYSGVCPAADTMHGNLYYATAMARVKLRRVPEPLPMADDVEALARYWKTHWNTAQGKGTEAEFVDHFNQLVLNHGTQGVSKWAE